ncbi:zinc-finger domain-containing protein [Mesobacillus zeae]|uniref:Zinc-finger domain-containing protein n=1 Tax=Mesobacillus zeae TaxID=1917180 RepID=A0A398B350_9BACI|nr:zinc-finger domain-containing protein [Mesobacillus zeae]
MTRKEWLEEVEELMSMYCTGCFLKQHHKKEKGKRYAHKFCITNCTVGSKIREYGDKLEKH